MKSKLILTCITVSISLCLLACSPSTQQSSIDASCDDFMKLQHISQEVELAVDGSLTVTLCSNPTTGFKWESAKISDPTVLKESSHEFVSPEESKQPRAGAAGKEVWTFEALKAGQSTISIEYSQSWEGGEKAAWTYDLTVVVQ